MSVLNADEIIKSYRGRRVVDQVTLEVSSGEVVGLLGPNGAGKTTLFHIVIGLVRADGGRVTLDGTDLTTAPIYRRARAGISYLPQESSVFRGLTVKQNLLAILETLGLGKDEVEERSRRLLGTFGLEQLADQKAYTLSGGERRRVEIARALILSPFFLLLDEPFTGVDPIALADIKDVIQRLTKTGIGVLITDHNVRETLEICTRAYILNEGVVLAEGTPGDIASSERARAVYLGEGFSL
ncbi:MAG: LPS export ABC transporter ATP-binding protein [Deltaproteobacteria bacterium]|nr:LPS export ABC transporter ATP-binding protein [Deltaproteobacteria bacterium]